MNKSRPKQIVIRVSEEEMTQIKNKVERSGMRQQDFLLKSILNKQIVDTTELKVILPELKRIGNNLNQIAKSCNEGNQATHQVVEQQGKELNEVWLLLKQFLQKQA